MTKARPQPPTGKESRERPSPKIARIEDIDTCELLLAELQARRVRLQRLLRLLWMDAEGAAGRRDPVRWGARCRSGRIERSA